MKTFVWKLLSLGLAMMVLTSCATRNYSSLDDQALILSSQGSFFVGGETKALPPLDDSDDSAGDITINQMYVQYQIPPTGAQHVPVVMVHGCCLSSKTWETTPDGRMGWNEYFVRRGRSVYLADQVSRGRSGFDATIINEVKAGNADPALLPNVLTASHQVGWSVFRFGPSFGTPFADGQFPVESINELYKQMIPDLNALLPIPNPTLTNMAALAIQLNGAILMGHSESGFFPEQAALLDPRGVRGIITLEMSCPTDLAMTDITTLAAIPTLVMFGDHLGDIQSDIVNWPDALASCQTYINQINTAGGDAVMMHLPELGIKGNSHMLMQDRNSDELADLILDWIDEHVES